MLVYLFILGAVASWGLYGPFLHMGQAALGASLAPSSPMRALLCVGIAYCLIGVLVPGAYLGVQGEAGKFTTEGVGKAIFAGTLGALGAVCIIYAMKSGGTPITVMPLVFGGAPLVNVAFSMYQHPPKNAPSAIFYAGILLAAAGAFIVLKFKPV